MIEQPKTLPIQPSSTPPSNGYNPDYQEKMVSVPLTTREMHLIRIVRESAPFVTIIVHKQRNKVQRIEKSESFLLDESGVKVQTDR